MVCLIPSTTRPWRRSQGIDIHWHRGRKPCVVHLFIGIYKWLAFGPAPSPGAPSGADRSAVFATRGAPAATRAQEILPPGLPAPCAQLAGEKASYAETQRRIVVGGCAWWSGETGLDQPPTIDDQPLPHLVVSASLRETLGLEARPRPSPLVSSPVGRRPGEGTIRPGLAGRRHHGMVPSSEERQRSPRPGTTSVPSHLARVTAPSAGASSDDPPDGRTVH